MNAKLFQRDRADEIRINGERRMKVNMEYAVLRKISDQLEMGEII